MVDRVAFEIAGERLVAFADRALYWPARKRLVLGDLHLGKADIFRAAGIPVPSGGGRRVDRINPELKIGKDQARQSA